MFKLSALRRRQVSPGYPAELPERIVAHLAGGRMSFQSLRRSLFGLVRMQPDDSQNLSAALKDLETAGKIRRFGRGHGPTFYEFTFYELMPEKPAAH
jgi:DNA-binding HxlR family transcriptional regulator